MDQDLPCLGRDYSRLRTCWEALTPWLVIVAGDAMVAARCEECGAAGRSVGVVRAILGIAHEYPEYEAMAEAVSNATEMVAMADELEAHGQRESGD